MLGWLLGSDKQQDSDKSWEEKTAAKLRYIDSWPGAHITDEYEAEMEEQGYEYLRVPNQGWQWVYVRGGKRGR